MKPSHTYVDRIQLWGIVRVAAGTVRAVSFPSRRAPRSRRRCQPRPLKPQRCLRKGTFLQRKRSRSWQKVPTSESPEGGRGDGGGRPYRLSESASYRARDGGILGAGARTALRVAWLVPVCPGQENGCPRARRISHTKSQLPRACHERRYMRPSKHAGGPTAAEDTVDFAAYTPATREKPQRPRRAARSDAPREGSGDAEALPAGRC